jgi:hypothetical protein
MVHRLRSVMTSSLLATVLAAAAVSVRADDTTTVVIPPPQIATDDPQVAGWAGIFCDRLAEKLEQVKGIAVVDRTEVTRVLAERLIGQGDFRQLLSYDALARVAFDLSGRQSRVTVSVYDLSMGNLVASRTLPWTGENDPRMVADMAAMCTTAAKAAAGGTKGKVRVRYTGVSHEGVKRRLQPIADKLHTLLAEQLKNSPKIVRVQHLDATSSVEESLFFYTGLTRLPGGRQFVPQADAAVDVRVDEPEVSGKPFEDAELCIEYRLITDAPSDWTRLVGTFGNQDAVIARAHQAITEGLSKIQPRGRNVVLDEMVVRRRQAEIEMDRFNETDVWDGTKMRQGFRSSGKTRALWESALRATATAAKLDPTYERGVYKNLLLRHARAEAVGYDVPDPGPVKIKWLQDGMGYLQRCPVDLRHRTTIIGLCAGMSLDRTPVTKDRLREFLTAKRDVLNLAVVEREYWRRAPAVHGAIEEVCRKLVEVGEPAEECHAWRDRALEKLAANILDHIGRGTNCYSWNDYASVVLVQVRLANDADKTQLARELIDTVMAVLPVHRRPNGSRGGEPWREQIERMNDSGLSARFTNWTRGRKVNQDDAALPDFKPYRIRWPTWHPGDPPEAPAVVTAPGVFGQGRPLRVLGRVGDRLYVYDGGDDESFQIPRPGCVPLDASGNPNGPLKLLDAGNPADAKLLKALPQRKVWSFSPAGTLRIYDLLTGTHKDYGYEQGYPGGYVYSRYADDTLLLMCGGSDRGAKRGIATFDISDETFIMHYWTRDWPEEYFPMVGFAWDGRKLRAFLGTMCFDDLLKVDSPRRPWLDRMPQGWRRDRNDLDWVGAARVVGPWLFVNATDGLRMVETSTGRTVRAWGHGGPYTYATWEAKGYADQRIPKPLAVCYASMFAPRTLPYAATPPPQMRPRIVILGDEADRWTALHPQFKGRADPVVCYDPKIDTWYGPVTVRLGTVNYASPAGPDGKVTHDNRVFLAYMPVDQIVRSATAAGRVTTTSAFLKRLRDHAAASDPLGATKFDFLNGQFDAAGKALTDILKTDPQNPDALYMMGMLYDWRGLNEPEKAEAYYRRMIAHKDPSVALAGLLHLYLLQIRQMRCREALATWDTVAGKYRHIPSGGGIDEWNELLQIFVARAAKKDK